MEKSNQDTNNLLRAQHYVKKRIRYYMKLFLSIIIGDKDIMNRLEQWLFHINYFHNKHVMLPKNKTVAAICEAERYMSYLTPTGFINGQYEYRFYANSSF